MTPYEKAAARLKKDIAEFTRQTGKSRYAEFTSADMQAIYNNNHSPADIDIFGLIHDSLRRGYMAGYRAGKRDRKRKALNDK